jgi:tRNA (adenine-N(1)-)-methyltransferase non-catalytic subunit
LVGLGKFGSFPASQLLGLHYDITYEITADPNADESSRQGTPGGEEVSMERNFGQMKGKKRRNNKGKGKDVDGCEGGDGEGKRNVGWRNILRPLKRQALVDAVIGELLLVFGCRCRPGGLDADAWCAQKTLPRPTSSSMILRRPSNHYCHTRRSQNSELKACPPRNSFNGRLRGMINSS